MLPSRSPNDPNATPAENSAKVGSARSFVHGRSNCSAPPWPGGARSSLLERFTRLGRMVCVVTAGLVLLVSFLPLTGSGTALSTRLVLGLMHLAVAAVLVPVLVLTSQASHEDAVTVHRSKTAVRR
ncbi:DUF6069 family protein [Micromonospora sicca]|uniref:DUF6069 family protein n=1 Tax=Micromonospora sicca TaxID=2202420 RepID=UPI0034CF1F77